MRLVERREQWTAIALMALIVVCLRRFDAEAAVVQVQACIDGKSELVIAPGGIYWHNMVAGWAKPGNYGLEYEITGPTYVDGQPWTPSWALPEARAEDVSALLPLDTGGFRGFALSTQYDRYFDSYPWGGTTLGAMLDLNRGPVTLASYAGCPSIIFDDGPFNGENVYSVNLSFVPEPIMGWSLGALALTLRRRRRLGSHVSVA